MPFAAPRPRRVMKGTMPKVAPAAAVTVRPMHTARAIMPPRELPMRERPQQKAAAAHCRANSTHRRPGMPYLQQRAG